MTHLAAVAGPHQQGSDNQEVEFCSYCGRLGGGDALRVCRECSLGVRLRTDGRALHSDGQAFLIVRGDGVISAASAAAERDLPREGPLVGRPLLALVSAPDGDLAGAVTLASLGTGGVATMRIEPVHEGGRSRGDLRATIASCGEPPAALVVIERKL